MEKNSASKKTPRSNLMLYTGGAAAIGLGYWWWTRPGHARDPVSKAVKREAAFDEKKASLSNAIEGAKPGVSPAIATTRNVSEDISRRRSGEDLVRDASTYAREKARGAAIDDKETTMHAQMAKDKIKETADDMKEKIKQHATSSDTSRGVYTPDKVSSDAKIDAMKQKASEAGASVKNAATDVKEKAQEAASDARNKVSNVAANAMDKTKEVATDAKDKIAPSLSMESLKESASRAKENVNATVQDAKEAVKEKAYDAKETMKEKAHDAKETIKEASLDAKDKVVSMASEAKEKAKEKLSDVKMAASDFKEKVQERTENEQRDLSTVGSGSRATNDVVKVLTLFLMMHDRSDRMNVEQLDTRPAADSLAAAAKATADMHLAKSTLASIRAERDREVLRNKDLPFSERALAAGDLAIRRAEGVYHDIRVTV